MEHTAPVLLCRFIANENDKRILKIKIFDTEENAILNMKWIAGNLTATGKKWQPINLGKGISCQLTEKEYPKQEWVVLLEDVYTWHE